MLELQKSPVQSEREDNCPLFSELQRHDCARSRRLLSKPIIEQPQGRHSFIPRLALSSSLHLLHLYIFEYFAEDLEIDTARSGVHCEYDVSEPTLEFGLEKDRSHFFRDELRRTGVRSATHSTCTVNHPSQIP